MYIFINTFIKVILKSLKYKNRIVQVIVRHGESCHIGIGIKCFVAEKNSKIAEKKFEKNPP